LNISTGLTIKEVKSAAGLILIAHPPLTLNSFYRQNPKLTILPKPLFLLDI
jgi:hypothetical protein